VTQTEQKKEGRTEAEKALKPAQGEKRGDNPHDA
jgi:hypothetical protein